jgi:DNA-binding transcriptional MerR regulator
MRRTIHDVSRMTGLTSRTLRHYDAIGLLPPSSTSPSGMRSYDDDALVRLQRILVLRNLGLGLDAITQALDLDHPSTAAALREHVAQLETARARVDRQIAAVQRTLTALEQGADLMTDSMFDGFDHTQHADEVVERWGSDAYATSDSWWRGLTADERSDFRDRVAALNEAWVSAWGDDEDPASTRAQDLAARHVAWLRSVPGTPAALPEQARAYVLGLADMYVADPRFAANYGGPEGAQFVRAALRVHLDA